MKTQILQEVYKRCSQLQTINYAIRIALKKIDFGVHQAISLQAIVVRQIIAVVVLLTLCARLILISKCLDHSFVPNQCSSVVQIEHLLPLTVEVR